MRYNICFFSYLRNNYHTEEAKNDNNDKIWGNKLEVALDGITSLKINTGYATADLNVSGNMANINRHLNVRF